MKRLEGLDEKDRAIINALETFTERLGFPPNMDAVGRMTGIPLSTCYSRAHRLACIGKLEVRRGVRVKKYRPIQRGDLT